MRLPRRAAYLLLAVGTVVIGLLVHLRGRALGDVPRDVAGDALYAMMMAWWLGAIAPHVRPPVRAVAAYALCVAIEVSQLWHAPLLDAIRATTLGHLILGSGFDPRDLLAYALGVALALLLEFAGVRRWRQLEAS